MRTNVIKVLLNDSELASVKDQAGSESVSGFVRRMLVGHGGEPRRAVSKSSGSNSVKDNNPIGSLLTGGLDDHGTAEMPTPPTKSVCLHGVSLKEYCPKCVRGKS